MASFPVDEKLAVTYDSEALSKAREYGFSLNNTMKTGSERD